MGFYGSYFVHGTGCNWYAASDVKSKVQTQAWLVELPGVLQIGEWHQIEIAAVGNEISFYIDGDLMLQRNDSMYPSGGVSLYAYNAIVEFDNVVITGDGIPDAGPSGYAVQPKAKLATTWGEVKR